MKTGRNKILPVPAGFSREDIRIESSICTGEKVIGFYGADRKLHCAEFIRTSADVEAFYRRYGFTFENDR